MATFFNKGKGLRSGALWLALRECLTEHLEKANSHTKDSNLPRGIEDWDMGGDYTAHFSSSSSRSPCILLIVPHVPVQAHKDKC